METKHLHRRPAGQDVAMITYKYKQGLTLIEMVVAVGIVAMLAAMIITLAARFDNQAKERELNGTMTLLEDALQEYHQYWETFPDPNQSPYLTHSAALYGQLYTTPESRRILELIGESCIKNNPDAVDNMPQIYDPWGVVLEYIYSPDDSFPRLISAGPDKVFATADDIKGN
ncbi:prepilin-type N-terminal cleavage/methylation domain-containing protein [Planctomycetota bacterium]